MHARLLALWSGAACGQQRSMCRVLLPANALLHSHTQQADENAAEKNRAIVAARNADIRCVQVGAAPAAALCCLAWQRLAPVLRLFCLPANMHSPCCVACGGPQAREAGAAD
jgi:hypothetical protein